MFDEDLRQMFVKAPAVGPSPSPGVGTRLPRPEPTKRSRARPQGSAQAAHEGSDVNCCLMTLKKIKIKKIEHKKIQSANLEFGRFEKALLGTSPFSSKALGCRWPCVADRAPSSDDCLDDGFQQGPRSTPGNEKPEMSNVPRNGQMTHGSSKDSHTNLILPCFNNFNRCQVDPSKLKAWIKTGQLYSKLFKVSLTVPCSLMYRFLLQISDASQDMDRRGLFQMIWTWPRDLHFDGRQQRIIWCKDGLLVSEDGPMPWSSWEFVNKSKSIVANQSKSSSSNMFAISSSCYCVVW